jgi:integrase
MARKVRPAAKIDSRSARLALPRQRRPYGYTLIAPGVWIGYRRTKGAGSWDFRAANGKGDYEYARIGTADDYEDADGEHVLDFWQACERGRQRARGQSSGSRPASWASALDSYEADLRARGGDAANARRVRHHLPPTLANKPVAQLSAAELRRWRDDLINGGAASATVLRTVKIAKASLNLAANLDPRIRDRSPWQVGLSGLTATDAPVNKVLADSDVLRLVAGAYALDANFGLVVDVLASTGTRTAQACRLLVADLQADGPAPRLLLPSSRKGGGRREITRRPVPITPSLAHRLKQAAGDRHADAPLLIRADGRAWNPKRLELRKLFAEVARRCGIACTAYSLRHSSIVRSLLSGVPTRLVAALHDTGIAMIERTYAAFIADHGDVQARRGLLDTAEPAAENVVSLPGRR